jgi:lipid-binding SYLF domain-containing protein
MNQFDRTLKPLVRISLIATGLALLAGPALADSYSDTISLFKEAGASATFFKSSYGYAVFPTVGKGGFIVGGAHGKGRVYRHGRLVGDTTVNQVSVGFQAGGQAYSEIIFFQTKPDLARFESGKFSLGAQASAVAITASASASTSTAGTSAGASGTEMNAVTSGRYIDGIVVFTIAKGGLMYEAAVAGQKFTYEPRD